MSLLFSGLVVFWIYKIYTIDITVWNDGIENDNSFI